MFGNILNDLMSLVLFVFGGEIKVEINKFCVGKWMKDLIKFI